MGDAVLDLLIIEYFFSETQNYFKLTNLKESLVNNKFFGHLSVKHNFSKHMCSQKQGLFRKISEYCAIHSRYSPDIGYLNLNHENSQLENECGVVDDVDMTPPKCLADIFEAVAGAIYLDSNKSFDAVWKCYRIMFEPYLG